MCAAVFLLSVVTEKHTARLFSSSLLSTMTFGFHD